MTDETRRVIGPRIARTPRGGYRTNATTALPDDVISEHVRRLCMAAAVGTGLWLYGLLMDTVIKPATVGVVVPSSTAVIETGAVLVSALLFAYLRFSPQAATIKADAGLGYLVLNGIWIALLNTWARPLVPDLLGRLSWTTIAILVSSMIMPSAPRKMLFASLAAASMDPLGVWLGHLRGLDTPSAVDTLVLFMPNYVCAAIVLVPTRALHRLGRRLRQARDLGNYHLVTLLGRGGMGEVWLGRHHLLARSAAIKLVRPELLGAGSPEASSVMLRRFEREAQATATLSSPHSIRLFDFGVTEDQTFYYVMELLSGRDLETLVRDFGPLPAHRVIYVLRQICHSLAEAHARGLVHRDVTPANIYLCRMGLDYDFVKVLDFGLVKFSDPRSVDQTLLTGRHTTTGTPAFMAPEVILDGEIDERADIYALGCVAYYLLTGQLVFEADTPMKMFLHHLQTPPLPPSARTELPIPPALDALVLACLEKDPARRPQSVDAVLRLLEQADVTAATWTSRAAETWWQRHLPEFAGPLSADAPVIESGVLAAVAGFSAR